jgi:predicted glycoside hydrolase/deacetylase ChbG (UPF0249 family)
MAKKVVLLLCLLALGMAIAGETPTSKPRLLLRLDDNGMNHSVTMAIQRVAETGIPFSTSVMFACPWYQEAVASLKKYPGVSVGVHLVLNSEWKYYRWGPVLGRTAVPSLVDADGFFLPSTEGFLASGYKMDEVKKELEAQIQRGLDSGLKIDYLDYHMLTAISTPELRAVVENLAKQHGIGMSRYFAEDYQSMFDVPVDSKKAEFFDRIKHLQPGALNLLVMHVAEDTPEMRALIDMNDAEMHSESVPVVAMHRSTELSILLSPEFQTLVKKGDVELVTYRDVIREMGLARMKAPAFEE